MWPTGFAAFTLGVKDVAKATQFYGGKIVKPAERSPWGGSSGYFADPDGYLWKAASGSGQQPFAE